MDTSATNYFWIVIGIGAAAIPLVMAGYFLFLRKLIITNCVPASTAHATLPVSGGELSNNITASTDNDTHSQQNSNIRYQRATELLSLASSITDGLLWLFILAFIFLLFKSQSITIFSILGVAALIIAPVSAGRIIIALMETFIFIKYPSLSPSTIKKKESLS